MKEQDFLARLAQRLGRPRPDSPPPRERQGVPAFYRADPLALQGAPAQRDLALRFQEEIALLGGQAYIEAEAAGAAARLQSLLQAWNPGRLLAWEEDQLPPWAWEPLRRFPDVLRPSQFAGPADFKPRAMQADVGVTGADFAVANTGTLLLCAGPGRPRAASLVVSSHLALLSLGSLVPRLGQALEAIARRPGLPSAVNCISGPSRTSDIENDATIGVHGPAQVTVLFGP